MKRYPAAAIAVAITLLQLPALFAQETGIKLFEGTWDQVLAEAKRQNKPIYLDAFASWCGPCKMLKRDIFPRSDVGAFFNANYISVSIDMEKGEGIGLARRYNVMAYPTHLYFDSDGTIVHRAVGGGAGDEFAQTFVGWARDARDPEKQFYTTQRRFDAGERDPLLLRRLAVGAAGAGIDEAEYYAIEYFRTQNDDEITNPENWDIIRELVDSWDHPGYARLVRNRAAFVKNYGVAAVDGLLMRLAASRLARIEGEKRYASSTMERGDSIFRASTSPDDVRALGGALMGFYQTNEDWAKYAETAVRYIEVGKVDDPQALNEVAWGFYEHVDDKALLAKAERWAAAALRASDTYAIADTYASLLFKLGRKKEAEKAAEHAISIGKKAGDDYGATQDLLVKIRAL